MFISLRLLKIEEFSLRKFPLLAMRRRHEKLFWVMIPGWCSGLAAGKVLLFFCFRVSHQQRRAGWHFKVVSHQETMD